VAALKTAWAKANPKKRAASNRAWHEANREKNNATKRSWKKSNPEKVRAWANAWDKANPEKKRAWGNAWYAANRERVATNSRAWKKANPEKKRAAEHRRRARKRSILGEVTAEDIKRMMAASSKCHFCKKPFTRKRPLTIDHVLPISSHLGSNDPNNLVLACASCNSSKGARRYNPRTGQGLLV
jgi:5-methylcytosine-specific restriction endonuclease McrA